MSDNLRDAKLQLTACLPSGMALAEIITKREVRGPGGKIGKLTLKTSSETSPASKSHSRFWSVLGWMPNFSLCQGPGISLREPNV